MRRWIAAQVLGLLVIAAAPIAQAGEFTIDGIAIDVPARFEGPVSAQPDASAQSDAFTVRAASTLMPYSVLQITVYSAAADPNAERLNGVEVVRLGRMQVRRGKVRVLARAARAG
jgi:hypothetical protein